MKGEFMRGFLMISLVGVLLAASPASAVVADKFECKIQLFKKNGSEGPKAETEIAVIRIPEAPDSDWIDGVSASEGSGELSLKDSGISVTYQLNYHLYLSQAAEKAAQWSCFNLRWETDGESTAQACGKVDPRERPYDPTDFFPSTPISNGGFPLFRSQDLIPAEHLVNSPRWSKFYVGCRYLGTFK